MKNVEKKMRDKLFSVIENELHLHSSQHLEVDMTDDVSKGWKKRFFLHIYLSGNMFAGRISCRIFSCKVALGICLKSCCNLDNKSNYEFNMGK